MTLSLLTNLLAAIPADPTPFGTMDWTCSDMLTCVAENAPKFLINFTSVARSLGAALCLCVAGAECFPMILGRKGMNILAIIRVAIVALCITFSPAICSGLKTPTKAMKEVAQSVCESKFAGVSVLENKVIYASWKYTEAVYGGFSEAEVSNNQVQKTDNGIMDTLKEIGADITEALTYVKNLCMKSFLLQEIVIVNFIIKIVRYIGLVIFQVSVFSVILGSICFSALLQMWAPIAFALSLVPAFKNAWSQWLSKFVSVNLWGFVAYFTMSYVTLILEYALGKDLAVYESLLANQVDKNILEMAGGIAGQAIGTTCTYIVGCLCGAALIAKTPEVASWLVPGGISSGFEGGAAGNKIASMGAQAVKTASKAII